MELYYSFSILIVIATIFAYLNKIYLKFPATIGVMVIAMLVSLSIVFLGNIGDIKPLQQLSSILNNIDFSKILMVGMLNFLLFAGAIHINLKDLKEQKTPIIVFSTISVILSTFIVGGILYYLLDVLLPMVDLHMEIPFIYCLLFGSLISPTDPIAVLAILKKANVSKSIETKIAGESLFNDGVAVVLFSVLLSIAQGGTDGTVNFSLGSIAWLLAKEAIGGLLVGVGLGYLAWHGIRRAADVKISVLISISVVMGGYLIATMMHISGPLVMVASGLIIGYNKSKRNIGGEKSSFNMFWELIDEILNSLLFLLIGFEILLIPNLMDYWLIGIICIVVVLMARYLSIKIPTLIIPFKEKFSSGSIKILVWGGLRGGVSIALALAVNEGPYKQMIIAATYFVVVFSIIVQGLTIGKFAKKIEV